MLEAKIQAKLIKQLEKKGWYIVKTIKTNKNGIPDILAFKPRLPPLFIEVKQKKGKLSEIQKYRINELKAKGFKAYVYYGH